MQMKPALVKDVAIAVILAAFAIHSHGQSMPGTVNFANTSQTALTNSAGTPFPPAGSTAYSVGLYWGTLGTSESSLELLPASRNGVTRTWYGDGKFNGGIASFPIEGGTQIQLQVRLWAGLYGSYEEAALNDPSPLLSRGIIQLITLGNAPATVPPPPADINFPTGPGDTPFRAFLVPAPEPSAGFLLLLALLFPAARCIPIARRTRMNLTLAKGIAILLVLAACVIHSRGQSMPGTVFFANGSPMALTNSAGIPFPPAGSTTYAVGFYWGTLGTPEGSLELLPAGRNGVTRTCCKSSADFQVCCIADFQIGRAPFAEGFRRLGNLRYSRFGNLRYDYCNRL
jgi:hypothetical protein